MKKVDQYGAKKNFLTMYRAQKNQALCNRCGVCEEFVACSAGSLFSESCTGCGACMVACPREAIQLIEVEERETISLTVNGAVREVPDGITVKEALFISGLSVGKTPECDIFTPCEVGACYACAVVVDGQVKPSCITPVRSDMQIETQLPDTYIPRRAVSGFSPHMVGGVGTPYYLKSSTSYIEAASFHHGCLFRCPQCQNYLVAFTAKMMPLTPLEVAQRLSEVCRFYGLDRIAFSGGECTLNKEFLLGCLRETRALNPRARLHVDTNGALLTREYLEELIASGMTDIGIDLKAASVDTFMGITGVSEELAERYGNTAWHAVRYLVHNHREDVFLGIGIPYNRKLISLEEIQVMGEAIARIDPDVQVVVLDYRPVFRRMDLLRPSRNEMLAVKKLLNDVGLTTVIVQTPGGHSGP